MRFAILLLLAAVASADQLTPYGKRTFHSVDGEWRLVTKESTGKFSFVLKNKAGVVRGKGDHRGKGVLEERDHARGHDVQDHVDAQPTQPAPASPVGRTPTP